MKALQMRCLAAVLVALGLGACATPADPIPPAPIRATLGPEWLKWPDRMGCDGEISEVTLQPGRSIDRYGDDHGTYFAEPGTSFEQRSLPYDEKRTRYRVYVVAKPLDVVACKISPWFGGGGGGIQFKASKPVSVLLQDGLIVSR